MPEVKVVKVSQLPSTLAERVGKLDRLVFYVVDGGPMQVLRMHDETFSPQAVEAAIKKELADTKGLVGHTFRV